ncbi:Pentatricopeptide repeat-containing protein [Nymphaea thermarum]|nr:Pentatricopeptide repeat-containing protein [Nymphaea thermarum]
MLGLRFFIWAGQLPNYRHTHLLYRNACDVLALNQHPELLIQVLNSYRQEGCVVSNRTFKEMLSLCKEAKLAESALALLRMMPDFSCRPDTVSYNVVVSLYSCKDIDTVASLVEEMNTHGIHPDMVTYIALIKGLCKRERWDDARHLLADMRNHGCVPNLVVYSALSDGMCKAGKTQMAMELIDEMQKGGCLPNVVTYTSLIQSFCEHGRSKEAIKVFDQMVANGCFPNRVTLIMMFNGLLAEGHLDESFTLSERSVQNGYLPCHQCYSLLVIALLRSGNMAEAEKLVTGMLENDNKPSGLACSTLIRELCAADRPLDAFLWYTKMDSQSCFLDDEVYSILLLGLCKQNHRAEATRLVNTMARKGIRLSASYVHCIMQNLDKHGQNLLDVHHIVDKKEQC